MLESIQPINLPLKVAKGRFQGTVASAVSFHVKKDNGLLPPHFLISAIIIINRLERKSVIAPKVLSIPIMSDKKCKEQRSEAAAKGRLCTAKKDENDICSVRLI